MAARSSSATPAATRRSSSIHAAIGTVQSAKLPHEKNGWTIEREICSPEDTAGVLAQNPVIVEAVRGSFAYQYARISSRTGLPTVMGWTGHEGQWHGLYDEIAQREQDVNLIYGGSVQDAKRLLDQYDVTYVVVGYLERADFPNAEAKFERFMDVVFREGNTVIFKRRGK